MMLLHKHLHATPSESTPPWFLTENPVCCSPSQRGGGGGGNMATSLIPHRGNSDLQQRNQNKKIPLPAAKPAQQEGGPGEGVHVFLTAQSVCSAKPEDVASVCKVVHSHDDAGGGLKSGPASTEGLRPGASRVFTPAGSYVRVHNSTFQQNRSWLG